MRQSFLANVVLLVLLAMAANATVIGILLSAWGGVILYGLSISLVLFWMVSFPPMTGEEENGQTLTGLCVGILSGLCTCLAIHPVDVDGMSQVWLVVINLLTPLAAWVVGVVSGAGVWFLIGLVTQGRGFVRGGGYSED